MKPIRIIACLLLALLASPADAANVRFYVGPTGQTLYVRVQTAASTFVAHALTEGTSGGLGNYTCAESTLDDDVTVASTGNGYPFTVRVGSASASADDPVVAYGDLPWSGTAEVSQATLNYAALLAATNGSDTVATQLARLDAAVSSAGGGSGTVSAFLVDKDHTWRFDNPSQATSPNIITENIGFVGLVSMDFTEPMPALGSISSITTTSVADVTGATEPTISSSAVSADKKKVHLTISCASATASTYTFSVKIATTDSQTIVRKGRLTVQ